MAMHFWAIAHAAPGAERLSVRSEATGYAAGLLTWFLAASVFVAFKLSAAELPPWTMSYLRTLLAFLVLVPVVARHHREMVEFLHRRWAGAFVVGAVGLGLTQGVMFEALTHTSAVNVGIVLALAPMITMVAARFLLGEPMNGWQALGTAIAFVGITVISVHGSLARLLALQIGVGDLIALGGAAMFAFYTVALKRARFELAPLPLLVILLAAGNLGTLPFFLRELWSGAHADLGTAGLLSLLYCAVFGSALMYLMYNWSVEVLGATRAGTLIYTQMLFVALLAWLVLGERPEWYHYAGGGLVVLGVLLVTLLRPRPTARAAPPGSPDRGSMDS